MTSYSPERRTALVLTGMGAHGVYQAGVMRALHEAGVKIDVVAGHGIGAGAAALAAIDGASRLWDPQGVWRAKGRAGLYGWRRPLRVAGWLAALLLLVLLAPVAVLAFGLVVFLLGFLFEMLQLEAGTVLVSSYADWLQRAFSGGSLPTAVPRLATIVLALLVGLLAVAGLAPGVRGGSRRTGRPWWWRVAGAPIDAAPARERFTVAIWELIRGAAPIARPSRTVLSRRYGEVLAENLSQPGFRELILVATDGDARRDVVAAHLAEPYRKAFLAPRPGRDRRAELLDLAGVDRDHVLDVVAAAVTPPTICDAEFVSFAADSFWRGETHRLSDRPGAVGRLLEEVAEAGCSQAIVVSAVAAAGEPHRLRAPRLDLRGRFGEFASATESAALRDALEAMTLHFDSIYVISPDHNPIEPFDLTGAHDEASDRHQDLSELMDRGYEDAYRQFIEPVVGASGDALGSDAAPDREAGEAGEFRLG